MLRGAKPNTSAYWSGKAFAGGQAVIGLPAARTASVLATEVTDVDRFVGEATNLGARERLSPWLK